MKMPLLKLSPLAKLQVQFSHHGERKVHSLLFLQIILVLIGFYQTFIVINFSSGVFHLYSVGPNMVVIRNISTGLYLSVEESTISTRVSK